MTDKKYFKKNSTDSGRSTKKKVLKITSVCVVAMMVLVTYHQIRFETTGSDPWTPPDEAPSRGNAGYEDFYLYVGDGMVNTANGNLYFTQKDISIKARGYNIEIIRSFNSMERTAAYPQDYFGIGWTCNYFIYLQEDRMTGNVTLTEGDGSVYVYGYWQAVGRGASYYTPAGKHGRLNKTEEGTFILRYLDGSQYNFDSNGALQDITDKNGNKIKFTYTMGMLTKVEEDLGEGASPDAAVNLNLNYVMGKIVNITDSTGRIVTYSYFNNTLINVTDPTGNYTLYNYGSSDSNPPVRFDSIIYKTGARVNFSYVTGLLRFAN